ncbi:diguanylate cyclase with GGDEF domain [Paucimonas lemoignei]|uniref:Diguanylate cyclase with GGDEF domain n=2 Tax=Paucimonas lemoignei TaxID=29443 RepID=A0A4R3I306_PAULE|nr:response regulator [Paucimonas lemoignei]TCS39654.1 diguanylate cyclase with GGDEF domain [Paucimonas lemoignei]
MLRHPPNDIPVKPRVLIADDSRIVRATLIKHIQGMFDFREALNGEEAWETLLIDPNIRVVITDLSMPRLDGYGLLKRIRSSEISRIRNLPVVVVSGSDEQSERDRAKAAGANDLITKGIDTAQLLSRLDVLAKLVNTQREFERSLEVLAKNVNSAPQLQLATPEGLDSHAQKALTIALGNRKNFVILNVMVGLRHNQLDGQVMMPPPSVVHAVGQLLQRTIRQSDRVAQTGEAEFTLATGSIHFDAARNFAQRICRAISNANMVRDEHMSFIASCGVASLSERYEEGEVRPSLAELKETAKRRAQLGLNLATTGVVGTEEELAFGRDGRLPAVLPVEAPVATKEEQGAVVVRSTLSFHQPQDAQDNQPAEPIELSTLVRWIKEGKQDKVLQHMQELSDELQPLVELLMRQAQGQN